MRLDHRDINGIDILQELITIFYNTMKHIIVSSRPPGETRKIINEALFLIKKTHEEGIYTDDLITYLYLMLQGFCTAIKPHFSKDREIDKQEKRNFFDFVLICLFGHVHKDTAQIHEINSFFPLPLEA